MEIVVQMQIYIMTWTEKMIPLRVKSSDTIASVKEKILDKEGIAVHLQYLLLAGRQLGDQLTLANYNIQEKSTLYLGLRMIGD
jgi:large subunit ribosomal protein L40e/small subunit ribosomal protein S27Ae/ubiquitin C